MKIVNENEIHLWIARDECIRDSELLNSYHKILSIKETKQQKSFRFDKHRHQYLITRALQRSVLSYYVNDEIRPEAWTFCENSYGKPYIGNVEFKNTLSFNLSHTENMIVLAVTSGRDVGVDVEWSGRDTEILELADISFSTQERDQLFSLPFELQADRFFDLWTLKEAYIKACGMGLSIPLGQFSFEFSKPEGINISFDKDRNDQPESWQFWQIQPDEEHKIAVAIKNRHCRNLYSLRMWDVVPLQHMTSVDCPVFRSSNTLVSAYCK